MNSTLEHPEVRAYLAQLRRLLANSPDRDVVIDDITVHIQQAATRSNNDPGALQQILNELGDPAAIAAGATADPGDSSGGPLRWRLLSLAVVVLLAIGGIAVPGLIWGIADYLVPALLWLIGFVLLWITKGWTNRQKAIGTFLIPALFAIAAAIQKLSGSDSTGMIQFTALAGYALLTVGVSIYLLKSYRTQH